MRTFQFSVYGTVAAATEQEALVLLGTLRPGGLDCDAVTVDEHEITAQICAECWCDTGADSRRCAECDEPAS
jgi:hypothetical protein